MRKITNIVFYTIAYNSPSFLWRFRGYSLFWYLPLPSEQLSYQKSRILPASRGWALSMKIMAIEWKIGGLKSYNMVELWFISEIKWYFSFKSYKDGNYPHLLQPTLCAPIVGD